MAQVIIRNIEDEVVERLKQVAATKGTSLEQELRSILAEAAYKPNRVLTELAQLRSLTPPGTRPLAEDLVREGRETVSAVIVDASVALKWFVEEEGSSDAADLIAASNPRLAPDLIIPEVLNAAWKAFSRGFMVREQYDSIPRLLPDLFQDIVPTKRLAPRAGALARELNHPAYDCFYLALAEEQNLPLVTADRRLINRVVDTKFKALVVKLVGQSG